MNIAFFGSSLVSAYWNGAATYYRGILKALNARGHRITFYEPDAYDRQKNRDMKNDPPYADVVVYAGDASENEVAALVRDAAANADVVVKASGVGVYDVLLERLVLDVRRPGSKIVFWDVDAPATLDRVNGDPQDPFHTCIPEYDAILTYGRRATGDRRLYGTWRETLPSNI
jgi:spore maturation protein CgeB